MKGMKIMVYRKLKYKDGDSDFTVLKTFNEFIEFMVGHLLHMMIL